MRMSESRIRQIIRAELMRETAHDDRDGEKYRAVSIARAALGAYEKSELDSEAFLENVQALLAFVKRVAEHQQRREDGGHEFFMFYDYERMLSPELENLGRDIAESVNGWDQGMDTKDLITALESLERSYPTFGLHDEYLE